MAFVGMPAFILSDAHVIDRLLKAACDGSSGVGLMGPGTFFELIER